MRFLFALAFAFILLSALPAPVVAQSQAEMNMTADKALQKADAELNKVYREVLAQRTEDPEFVAVLKESQRAWLKFVESHLKMLFFVKEGEDPRVEYGSMYPMLFAGEKTALIKTRTKQLRELILE